MYYFLLGSDEYFDIDISDRLGWENHEESFLYLPKHINAWLLDDFELHIIQRFYQ